MVMAVAGRGRRSFAPAPGAAGRAPAGRVMTTTQGAMVLERQTTAIQTTDPVAKATVRATR